MQDVPYVLWLMCALVPWLYFSDILTGCTTSLLEYAHLIKKTVFPARILPLVRAGSAGFIHGVFATLLWLAFLIAGEPLSLYAVQGYYFSTCTMLLGLGLGYLTASLAPFFKDIAQTVGILLQIGFWVTPIAWSPEIMSPTIQTVLRINPMFYIVQGWQRQFIGGVAIWERPLWALYFWLVTAAIWTAAIILFKKFRAALCGRFVGGGLGRWGRLACANGARPGMFCAMRDRRRFTAGAAGPGRRFAQRFAGVSGLDPRERSG